jgi:hypothetical protein
VHDGLGRPVELGNRELPLAVRAEHGDHPLVVSRDGDRELPVAVDVPDLGVAHAAELPSEIRFPESLRPHRVAELDGGLRSAQRQQASFP